MVEALHEHVERGWVQLFCVDSVDAASFYSQWARPVGRIIRHMQHEEYILDEVLSLSRQMNSNPFLISLAPVSGPTTPSTSPCATPTSLAGCWP